MSQRPATVHDLWGGRHFVTPHLADGRSADQGKTHKFTKDLRDQATGGGGGAGAAHSPHKRIRFPVRP